MTENGTTPPTNSLLQHLSKQQQCWFLEHCTPVELVYGDTLNLVDERIKYVYFPITGFIALLEALLNEPSIEMGLIGNEGMLGATLALDIPNAPMQAIVQGGGSALRMDAALFRHQLTTSSVLRKLTLNYL